MLAPSGASAPGLRGGMAQRGVREGFLEVVRLGLTYELYYIQVSAQGTSKAGPLPHESEMLLQEFKVIFKKDAQ